MTHIAEISMGMPMILVINYNSKFGLQKSQIFFPGINVLASSCDGNANLLL